MGYLVKLKCSTCEIEKTMPVGFGIKDYSLPNPKKIYYCTACHSFQSLRDGESCNCGAMPILVFHGDIEIGTKIQAVCPQCNNALTITPEGLWD